MRVFSKKAFRFNHPSGSPEIQPLYIRDNEFTDLPDWVAETATFKLAAQDESITVIETKKDEKAAETGKSSRKKDEEK